MHDIALMLIKFGKTLNIFLSFLYTLRVSTKGINTTKEISFDTDYTMQRSKFDAWLVGATLDVSVVSVPA